MLLVAVNKFSKSSSGWVQLGTSYEFFEIPSRKNFLVMVVGKKRLKKKGNSLSNLLKLIKFGVIVQNNELDKIID